MYDACPRPVQVVQAIVFLLGTLGGVVEAAQAPAIEPLKSETPPAAEPVPLLLEEMPEPLPPKRERSEAEEDRVEALALFSAARTFVWKQQPEKALRYYQRALRYDPSSATLARAVVRLALELERPDEAVRVAAKVEDLGIFSPRQLLRLGVHLMQKGDWQLAIPMYEEVFQLREGTEPSAADIALSMEMGRLYSVLESYPKAADCFARVRQALEEPDQFGLDETARKKILSRPGVAFSVMGKAFLETGRLDDAEATFREAHRLVPNQEVLNYRLATIDLKAGKPGEALAKLETVFGKHLLAEGTGPYRLLLEILEELDRKDELIPRLEALRAEDADNVRLNYFLAQSYFKAGQFDRAEELYRRLAKKTPTLAGYRNLAAILRKTERIEALLTVIGEAVGRGSAIESLGPKGQSIVDDPDLLARLLETARKRHQEDPAGLNHDLQWAVALLALRADDLETAAQFFELALKSEPDRESELLLTWGLGLLTHEEYAKAAAIFQRGIDQESLPAENPAFYYYRSAALEMASRTEEALVAARKASQFDPDSARYLSRVAWILYHAGRRSEAAKAYRDLIERFDSDHGSADIRQVMRESRRALSNLAVLGGRLPEAVEWLEQVLDEFPDDIAALNDLGYLWADAHKKPQRAHRMIRQAVQRDPENAAYRDSLGWILYRLGRHEEALVELEKAVALGEPDPVILDHLGDAYQAAASPEKAKEAWRRAAAAFREQKETEKVKEIQKKLKKSP